MYPNSCLLALYLLNLKGLFIHTETADVICAPVNLNATLSSQCRRPNGSTSHTYMWRKKSNNETKNINMSLTNKYRRNNTDNICSLTIMGLTKADAGIYSFSPTQRFDSSIKTITVYVTDLQVNVSKDRMTEGQIITLICNTSRCPSNKLNFIWYKNGRLLNLQHSNNKLNVGPVSSKDTGRYSCALKDYKSFPSTEKDINVLYAPRNTTVSVRYLETGDVNLTCSSDAHPKPKYNWFNSSDTGQILGQGQRLTVKTGNTGFFYCKATNTIGSHNSTVIRLTGINSDVMFDRSGFIISLLSLLILLMLISAAGWRIRKNLRHPEGNETNTQNDAHVYSNIHGPVETFKVKKREESDDNDEVQYSYLHFSKYKDAESPAVTADVQYDAIKVSQLTAAPY